MIIFGVVSIVLCAAFSALDCRWYVLISNRWIELWGHEDWKNSEVRRIALQPFGTLRLFYIGFGDRKAQP